MVRFEFIFVVFLIGIMFSLLLVDYTIEHTTFADKLLNSGKYSIDTIYTINKADTTIKYKFTKIK